MAPDRSLKLFNSHQRGVALISILLVLTVLATLAIYAAEDQNLAIRRSENLSLAEQGYQVNQSGEQWVLKVLEKDIVNDLSRSSENAGAVDHRSEIWGNLGPPVEVGETGVSLLMTIEDLQSKFNLNNLVEGKRRAPSQIADQSGQNQNANNDSNGDERPPVFWYQVLQNIFAGLSINPELIDPLIDWVDSDEELVGTTGAEDFFYTGLERPYRTANRGISSVAELTNVKDFNTEIMEKISPWVTALPLEDGNLLTKINVNTAPARVLAGFAAEPLDVALLNPLIEQRKEQPFLTLEEFRQQFNVLVPGGLVPGYETMLGVSSIYFAGHSCADSGRVKFSMTSLMKKQSNEQNVKVLKRERFFGCPSLQRDEAEQSKEPLNS
jgi:general secretion pathway protein K